MTFLYPLGLLGLIAVPVLIIIYIIKNKYTEQVISSTYLWELSNRFLKNKKPISAISGLVSLILQILAVVMISFAIAQPVFTIPGGANDYLFIVDGSGSMNMTENGQSRFERGKEEISSLISSSAGGSSYTLVLASDSAETVFEKITDKSVALARLDETDCGYSASGFTDARSIAQEYFTETPSMKIYLVTDKTYESSTNVEVINVAGKNEINYAVTDITYSVSGENLTVSGSAWSYNGDAAITVGLYVDGAADAQSVLQVNVKELEGTPFTFTSNSVDFQSLRVAISETDSCALDNESVVYNLRNDSSYSTLIVSDSPFFLQAALVSFGTSNNVETVSTAEYTGRTGYSLYIFDGFTPDVLPSDGAVWFINPRDNLANTNFTVQDPLVQLAYPAIMTYSTSTSTRVRNLLAGTAGEDIYFSRYVKCGFNRSFYTLLSYGGDPLLFVGNNGYGNREVVFAFDLHDSDFALTFDMTVLVYNLFGYTFPEIISSSSYYSGDTVEINVPSNCESIRVVTPLGNVEYLDAGSDLAEYRLTEVGVYTVTMILGGGSGRSVEFYSNLPMAERSISASEQSFVISGEPDTDYRDGTYDDLIVLFILLAVIVVADWMVYCYEQYQLR